MDNIQFAIRFDLDDRDPHEDLIIKLEAALSHFRQQRGFAEIGTPDADCSGICRNDAGTMIAAWTLE